MKKLIILSMACLGWTACLKDKTVQYQRVGVSAVPDLTDIHLLQLNARMLLDLYQMEANPGIEMLFRILPITDSKLPIPIEYHLANMAVTERRNKSDNPKNRSRLIQAFKDSLVYGIDRYHEEYDKYTPLQRSLCYETIAGEIRYLAKLKYDKSYLVIYSNLFENSEIFNCYSPGSRAMLKYSPAKVADTFAKACPLPRGIRGLTVIFVYNTHDNDEADLYLAMIEVYKKILEPKGIQVVQYTADGPINRALYEPQQ